MKALLVLCFVFSFSACFAENNNNDHPVLNTTSTAISSVTPSNTSVSVDPPIPPAPLTTPKSNVTTTTTHPTTPITTTPTTPTTKAPTPTTTKTTVAPITPSSTTTSTTTTTPKPNVTTTTPPPPHKNERKFDGPSFVGGMILALGLVAIGFVAFKFYKARTELNYHTL